MYSSKYCSDFFYRNHIGKVICYQFNFTKRVKGKVRYFLKKHPCEGELMIYLKDLGLKLNSKSTSRNYIKYDIVDCEV